MAGTSPFCEAAKSWNGNNRKGDEEQASELQASDASRMNHGKDKNACLVNFVKNHMACVLVPMNTFPNCGCGAAHARMNA